MKAWKLVIALLLPAVVLAGTKAAALGVNGTAAYSELGSQLYLGTLYLEAPSTSAADILASSQKKRIEIRFSETMSKRRWAQTWTQSIAINSSRDDMVNAAGDLSEFLSAFQSSLEPGDAVIIDYDPLYGTSATVNGVDLVKEKSTSLFNLFLSAWIGPVPPSSQFKSAILGESDSANDHTAFLAIAPAAGRVDAIKSWSTKLKEEEEAALAEAQAEEEAMRLAEEEAEKKAQEEALAEEQRLALIEEEKRKAQEAARKAAEEEAARREAERVAALNATEKAQEQQDKDEEVDLSVEAILAQQDYTGQIIAKIYKSVKYPSAAVKRNQEGSVRASVTIDRAGNLAGITLVEESEFSILNKAVLNAVNDAAPFPAIPSALRDDSVELIVPVAFKLN